MSYLLVLTATVHPKGMGNLKIADPAQRLEQYKSALTSWLIMDDPDVRSILFIENSGADLTPFNELVRKQNTLGKNVELVGLDVNDYPRDLGKGYGEFLAVDRGLAQSALAKSHRFHAKITGRLGIRNLGAIIRRLPADYDMAVDVWPGVVDSRLVFWSREFYEEHILGLYRQMCDATDRFAETLLLELMLDYPQRHFISCLPLQPDWVGHSGTHGIDYGHWRQRILFPLRQIKRLVKRGRGLPDLELMRAQRAHMQRSTPDLEKR